MFSPLNTRDVIATTHTHTHLLSGDDHALAQPDPHGGQLEPGLVGQRGQGLGLQGQEGQRGAGPGQGLPQQGPQLFGHGGRVRHVQGHVQRVGHHVRRALASVVLQGGDTSVRQKWRGVNPDQGLTATLP